MSKINVYINPKEPGFFYEADDKTHHFRYLTMNLGPGYWEMNDVGPVYKEDGTTIASYMKNILMSIGSIGVKCTEFLYYKSGSSFGCLGYNESGTVVYEKTQVDEVIYRSDGSIYVRNDENGITIYDETYENYSDE